jgi:hypothetical protein
MWHDKNDDDFVITYSQVIYIDDTDIYFDENFTYIRIFSSSDILHDQDLVSLASGVRGWNLQGLPKLSYLS